MRFPITGRKIDLRRQEGAAHPFSQRLIKSGIWVFAIRISEQLIQAVRLIILARILAPSDFGIMGAALLAASSLQSLTQTGFSHALIQKKSDINAYLNTAWTTQVIRGVLVFIVLAAVAPLTAGFFNMPQVTKVVWAVAFGLLLESLGNVGIVYFEKELEFEKKFIYQISGTLSVFIFSVSLAFILRNVWALAAGFIIGSGVRAYMSYRIHSFKPVFSFDQGKAKELFKFGRWVFGSGILFFLLTQGDDIFVGKFIGIAALGLYQMAYKISNVPATEFSHLIASVAFPAYSKVQDNIPVLRRLYKNILQIVLIVCVPLTGLIFIFGSDITEIFLGSKWSQIAPVLRILAWYGLLRAMGATTGVVFLALGRPQIRTRIQIAQLSLLALLIYPLTAAYGIIGTSLAVTLDALLFNLIAVGIVCSMIRPEIRKIALAGVFSLAGFSLMSLVVWVMKSTVLKRVCLANLLIMSACGTAAYVFCVYFSDVLFGYLESGFIKKQLYFFLKKEQK